MSNGNQRNARARTAACPGEQVSAGHVLKVLLTHTFAILVVTVVYMAQFEYPMTRP